MNRVSVRRVLWVAAALGCAGMSPAQASDAVQDARSGPFALFDTRSQYGKGAFPEPFLVDDSDLERNEIRLDWRRQEGKGQRSDGGRVELEKGFGLATVELEVPYEYDTASQFDPSSGRTDHSRVHGFAPVAIGARQPVYQYVSRDEVFDATFGVAFEAGLPTNSPVGKTTEFVPKAFSDLRVGEHFTMQTVLGYSFLRGSRSQGGGEQTFEYGLVVGWTIPHEQLPLPDVEQFIPIFELQGDTLLNTHESGANTLTGNIAFRANLQSIGPVQPRVGLGYVFPIDRGARAEFDWGITASLVLEF